MLWKTIPLLAVLLLGALNCWCIPIEVCTSDNRLTSLASNIRPSFYRLDIDVDLKNKNFGGTVNISLDIYPEFDALLGSNRIALNAHPELNIVDADIAGVDNEVSSICRQKGSNIIIIELKSPLIPHSRPSLELRFASKISDGDTGLYYASHTHSSGKLRPLAVTQFETNHASEVFPCFDEPSFKSSLALTVSHALGLECVSNTDIAKEEVVGTRRVVKFKPTPVMSSYLLALAIGEFSYLERVLKFNGDGLVQRHSGRNLVEPAQDERPECRLRIYTPVGRQQEAEYAMWIAAKAFARLEQYFGVEYPLEKLDFVSVPKFKELAMENWGMIVSKDSLLLLADPEDADMNDRLAIARNVVHEISHQWFGNLVTLERWSDIWLHEGFAKWFEFRITAELLPEFNLQQRFLLDTVDTALEEDSGSPMAVAASAASIADADKSDEVISGLVYDKGASLIEMFSEYMGAEAFRSYIRLYLNKFAYKNVDTMDFLTVAREKPNRVRSLMKSWLWNVGHPVVGVQLDGKGHVKLSVNSTHGASVNQVWLIPVKLSFFEHNNLLISSEFLLNQNASLKTPFSTDTRPCKACWLLLNSNSTRFYSVDYSDEILPNLRDNLRHLSSVDKVNLLVNFKSLSDIGAIDSTVYLERLLWFSKETNYDVLEALFQVQQAGSLPEGSFLKLFSCVAERTGFNWRSQRVGNSEQNFRSRLLMQLVLEKHQPTIGAALKAFERLKRNRNSMPSFLRTPLYTAIVLYGTEAQRSHLLDELVQVRSVHHRSSLVQALSNMDTAEGLERLVQVLKRPDFQLKNKLAFLFGVIYKPAGCRVVKRHLEESKQQLIDMDLENADQIVMLQNEIDRLC